jgi:RND family efflux transporter MFP subunit
MKLYLLTISILVTLVTAGCHPSHDAANGHDADAEQPDQITLTCEQAAAAGVQTLALTAGTFSCIIKTGGRIQPAQGDEVVVAATASGIVSFVHPSLTDGSSVQAGEALVSVSARNLPDGDPRLKTKMAYETALKDYRRAEALVKDQIIASKDFEQTRLRYETARAAYEAQVAYSKPEGVWVTAPISGFVKTRWVNEGDYVTVGQPVAVVAKNKRLQLCAEVPERYFQDLRSIYSAHFKTAYGNTVYKLADLRGRLLSFGKGSGQQPAFYLPVLFEMDNPGDLIPGAFAEIYLLGAPQENVLTVPTTAVTEEQGHYFVYRQVAEEAYKKQAVVLGNSDGERLEVLAGLEAGDVVVTQGAYQVKLAGAAPTLPAGHSH